MTTEYILAMAIYKSTHPLAGKCLWEGRLEVPVGFAEAEDNRIHHVSTSIALAIANSIKYEPIARRKFEGIRPGYDYYYSWIKVDL